MSAMTTGATTPDLAAFRALADARRVIPVTRRFLADGETPVGLYRKLAAERPGTFLLESAEHGVWSRYSFVGVRSAAALTERDGAAAWIGSPPVGRRPAATRCEVLRATLELLHTPHDRPRRPAAADRRLGRLPRLRRGPPPRAGRASYAKDDLDLPELTMLLAADLAVLDHADGTVALIANAINLNGTPRRRGRGVPRRRRPARRDGRGPAPGRAAASRRSWTSTSSRRSPRTAPARTTGPRWTARRRRSGPARRSRS